ncbi:MAG: glycosyltransferase domain-containing protein [Chitinispirillaceae bacterium]
MKKNIAIYTSIFGGYDGLLPQKKIDGVDYICFSDRPHHSRTWDVRVVEPVSDDPTRSSRHYKILPHRYLKDYETSIFMDGNFLVVGNAVKLVQKAFEYAPMAAFPNSKTAQGKGCVYEEYNSILALGEKTGRYKDDPVVMKNQIERYKKENYPEINGLITSGVLVRRHHNPRVIDVMERWWNELKNGSKRDQLSFNYSAWRENFDFSLISGNIRDNECFFMLGKHRKNFRGKLLRYHIRRFLGLKRHDAPLTVLPPRVIPSF